MELRVHNVPETSAGITVMTEAAWNPELPLTSNPLSCGDTKRDLKYPHKLSSKFIFWRKGKTPGK